MAKKLMKICCTWKLLIIREMQIKTTMRYHFIVIIMPIIKKSINNKFWRGCGEKRTLLHCWWECKLIQPPWRTGLPRWYSGKEYAWQCRRHKKCGFNARLRKIPWSMKWQLIPVFLPGKFHAQRSLVGYRLWCRKESDTTEHLYTHPHIHYGEQYRGATLYTHTMKNNSSKNRTTIWPSSPTPVHLSEENCNSKRCMHPNVLSSAIYKSQDMEVSCR